jgi:hypothetical protein
MKLIKPNLFPINMKYKSNLYVIINNSISLKNHLAVRDVYI